MDFTKYIPEATPAPSDVNADSSTAQDTLISQEATAAPEAQSAPPVEQSQQTNTDTQIAAPASAPAEAATPAAIDYNSFLDTMSGGIIKDEAGFKAVLPKLSEYDSLKQKHDELSAAMAKAPTFANDHVRILNELIASGASKDQLKSFQKINEYGEINEMPDREARIAKMVMIDGIKPNIAEIMVDREFKLGDEDLDETDRLILDENLRVAALKDKADLSKFKAELGTVNTVAPEEQRLQYEAKLQNHIAQVKPYVKEVAASINSLGSFTLKGKTDADAINLDLKLPETFRPKLEEHLQNYFADGLTPVTPENTREAINYAHAEYIRENLPAILQSVKDDLENTITERIVNKYENRSGLKNPGDNPVIQTNADAEAATWFQNKVNRVGK